MKTKAQNVQVLSNNAVHSDRLKELGIEVVKAVIDTADKYFAVVEYIRKHTLPPKLVAFELGQIGFARATVSKLNRLANAPADVFDLYAAKTVGFNKALKLTRGEADNIKKLTDAHLTPEQQSAIEAAAAQAESEAEAEEAERGASDTTATRTTRLAKVCIQALKLMEALNKKTYTKTREGFTLTIVKAASKPVVAK